MDILKRINWIDILTVILLVRIGYVSLKRGFPAEFFKFCGTLTALFVALHFYPQTAQFIHERATFVKISPKLSSFISFLYLAFAGYLIFMFLRFLFCRFIQMEATPRFNKWGGFIIGMARGFLFISLLYYAFLLSPLTYFADSVRDSYAGKKITQISVNTYSGVWNAVLSKFLTKSHFNGSVLKVVNSGDTILNSR